MKGLVGLSVNKLIEIYRYQCTCEGCFYIALIFKAYKIHIPGEPKRIGIPTNMTVTSKILKLEKIN